ncbi:hypothetical protein [Streptomyces daghestanicus]|uniref:Uncharacterized protein n=1 Tax=Streptomyces daghestanicus TaxID=66885 RepID=A0ABQ3Q7Z7_9ACTN|nr:hypothetical protein [Streptomyces daghestanicus]GGU67779.1 hypothetical protein GCM10010259_67400 [Streptomyces daghestanicus]GHI33396.1 hypothetical protein Sdagh_51260 [Streptomyces daghestanicus]
MKGFAETPGELCPDCEAGPGRENACVGAGTPYEMWHTPDCPQWTIMQIGWEAGSRQSKEQDAWARDLFPAAHECLKQAAAALPSHTPAQLFDDALTELVQAQADTTGFVVLHRWAEILERHFPPPTAGPRAHHRVSAARRSRPNVVRPRRRPRSEAGAGGSARVRPRRR